MRLFLASDLPATLRDRLAQVQRDLSDLPLAVRWTRPESMHLTFQFLGEVEESRLETIGAALSRPEVGASSPFHLDAVGLGAFPRHGRPRLIFCGIEGDREAASQVRSTLGQALAPAGFPPDGHPFQPHLTLGRVRDGRNGSGPLDPRDWRSALARQANGSFGTFEVSAVTLFESRLSPDGAQYRSVARFPLAGARSRSGA